MAEDRERQIPDEELEDYWLCRLYDAMGDIMHEAVGHGSDKVASAALGAVNQVQISSTSFWLRKQTQFLRDLVGSVPTQSSRVR